MPPMLPFNNVASRRSFSSTETTPLYKTSMPRKAIPRNKEIPPMGLSMTPEEQLELLFSVSVQLQPSRSQSLWPISESHAFSLNTHSNSSFQSQYEYESVPKHKISGSTGLGLMRSGSTRSVQTAWFVGGPLQDVIVVLESVQVPPHTRSETNNASNGILLKLFMVVVYILPSMILFSNGYNRWWCICKSIVNRGSAQIESCFEFEKILFMSCSIIINNNSVCVYFEKTRLISSDGISISGDGFGKLYSTSVFSTYCIYDVKSIFP